MRQLLISLRCGTDIIDDFDSFRVIGSEMFDQRCPAAGDVQFHQIRTVFVFPQNGEDIGYIFFGDPADAVQIVNY